MTARVPNQAQASTSDKVASRLLARGKTKRSVLLPQFKERMVLPSLAGGVDRTTKNPVSAKS